MDISFGFSWQGLVAFILTMLPNVGYFIKIKKSAPPKKTEKLSALDITEHTLQAVLVAMLIFIVSTQSVNYKSPFIFIAAGLLLLYYACFIPYFLNKRNTVLVVLLAVIPVLYFVSVEIWLTNYFTIIPTVLFGIIHLVISLKNR